MDVKEAVRAAKAHVADLFADEAIEKIGLEEVDFDEASQVWAITIGFARAWDRPTEFVRALSGDAARTFKLVRIEDASGRVRSVKHRVVEGVR